MDHAAFLERPPRAINHPCLVSRPLTGIVKARGRSDDISALVSSQANPPNPCPYRMILSCPAAYLIATVQFRPRGCWMADAIRTKRRIDTEEAAVAFFAPGFIGMRRESLRVAHLDHDRALIGLRLHYSDLCDTVSFPLRTIIHDALQLGSAGVLIAHNHPSGDPAPSSDDLLATRMLVGLARPLGIRVHDHLIFAGDRSSSLCAMGML
ncbi:MAG: JAB domain-containing protein [Sphingomonas sp.]